MFFWKYRQLTFFSWMNWDLCVKKYQVFIFFQFSNTALHIICTKYFEFFSNLIYLTFFLTDWNKVKWKEGFQIFYQSDKSQTNHSILGSSAFLSNVCLQTNKIVNLVSKTKDIMGVKKFKKSPGLLGLDYYW